MNLKELEQIVWLNKPISRGENINIHEILEDAIECARLNFFQESKRQSNNENDPASIPSCLTINKIIVNKKTFWQAFFSENLAENDNEFPGREIFLRKMQIDKEYVLKNMYWLSGNENVGGI